jgi:hypothetical protein
MALGGARWSQMVKGMVHILLYFYKNLFLCVVTENLKNRILTSIYKGLIPQLLLYV